MDRATKIKEASERMRKISDTIKPMMPPGNGYILLTFDYGEKGELHYLSSARREDSIKVLEEFLVRLKANKGGN